MDSRYNCLEWFCLPFLFLAAGSRSLSSGVLSGETPICVISPESGAGRGVTRKQGDIWSRSQIQVWKPSDEPLNLKGLQRAVAFVVRAEERGEEESEQKGKHAHKTILDLEKAAAGTLC